MKLNETQLAGIFRHSTRRSADNSSCAAEDALRFTPASEDRLDAAEQVVSDATAARAFQQTVQLKPWSEALAASISQQQNQTSRWFSFLKPLAFATAMASAVWMVLPTLSDLPQMSAPPAAVHMQTADRINNNSFDRGDVIGQGSFDNNATTPASDQLFNHSFS